MLTFLSICAGESFNLTSAEIASITSCVFAGQLVGTAFWGPFADRFGRRLAFIAGCSMIALGGKLVNN